MPVRTLVKWPDRRLLEVSQSIDPKDSSTHLLVRDLVDTMKSALGVGLAAPQVGISKSICVICSKAYGGKGLDPDPVVPDAIVLVNPKITPLGSEKFSWQEGCLSVDDIVENVTRHEKISIEYEDLLGKKNRVEVFGTMSGVIQHETDHLIGKTFLERVSADRRRRAKSMIMSKKRLAAQRLKKQIKKEKREAALERAQSEEPPKPGFRRQPSNKGSLQKSKRKKIKKTFGRNKKRK